MDHVLFIHGWRGNYTDTGTNICGRFRRRPGLAGMAEPGKLFESLPEATFRSQDDLDS